MNDDIELLLAFAQTRTQPDPLATPDGLRRWLIEHRLLAGGDGVSGEDVRRVRHFRAALTSVLRERFGAPPDPRTRAALATVPLGVTVGDRGALGLEPAGASVEGALSRLMAALYRVSLSGDMERLKVCKGCASAFFDASKNRSRIWCDMARCGAQDKARTYRRRRAGAPE